MMNIRKMLLRSSAFSVLTIACMGLGSLGVAANVALSPEPIAKMKSGPGGISWESRVPYKQLILVVQTPRGKIIRKAYAAGSKLAYGEKLADGQYKYELTVVPDVAPDVREALKKARATGDRSIVHDLRAKGALPQGPQVQSGSFRVLKGKVVSPQEVEPTSKRKKD
ncbi:MAG: hypothetical protein ACR2PS_00960 [Pseudomonadales bacterium]